MAKNNFQGYATPAREIRGKVLSKENFVWATTMKQIKFIYGVANLGRNIVKEIRDSLQSEGVECFSGNNREPTQEKDPIFLFLKGCEHSVICCDTYEHLNHNGHVSNFVGLSPDER